MYAHLKQRLKAKISNPNTESPKPKNPLVTHSHLITDLPLKPETPVGDNLLTALSVARQSGLVSAGRQMIVVKAQYAAASAKAAQHLKVYYFDADYDGGLRNQVGP